ncbi:CrcB family protein [Prochlorococcus sp. MIT 0604]|uniref:CrcB family protein n=1 Tax=Prochlorococcus sp. MIT 0604 TaxID=1501268 RepID=UPI0005B47C97|nr:CrcB family protein [Prochlorococcus sp. MIT 0604]
MDFSAIGIILIGSTFGLILRIFIQNNFKKSMCFDIQNTSIVNFLSSFFLGILVAFNFINNEILALFYSGFLGCFSTFSTFIYQLFILFKKREFLRLFLHYIAVIIFSFFFFFLGYFLIHFF